MTLFSLISFNSTVAHPTLTPVHRHAFLPLFVCYIFVHLFYLTLIRYSLLLSFSTSETFSFEN